MSHNPDWMLRHRCDRLGHELRAAEARIERLVRERTELVNDLERIEFERDEALFELARTRDEVAALADQLADFKAERRLSVR